MVYVLCYIDHDKKTYNHGLIMTVFETDCEITQITARMRRQGRDVNIHISLEAERIKDLPPLNQPISDGIEGYTYDPRLMW